MELVDQVEIQLGHLCNNRCVFCASGFITGMKLVGQENSDKTFAHLSQARSRGARKVTFVGGEPTLQRDFPAIVQRARELGYEEIVVFTNGVRTQQREYLEELLEAGPLTFRISIQGGTEDAHDRVTGRPGSFQRIVDGMQLMNELGQKIQCNACLNVHSYQSVEGYPELAHRFGISEVHLDQINPHEIGNRSPEYIATILARYSDQAPHLSRMLTEFERRLGADYDVHLGNIPYCVMPDWAHRIYHAGQQTLVVSANLDGPHHEGHDKYERKTERVQKPPSCVACVFDPICSGVFDEYAETFGTEELVPIPAERLSRGSNASHLFTLLERDALLNLARSEAPAGARLRSAEMGPRDPEARFFYEIDGRTLELSVRHPTSPGSAVAVSERVALYVSAAQVDEPLARLVRWAFERLQRGERVLVQPELGGIEQRWRWGMGSREQLARLFDTLRSQPTLGRFVQRRSRMNRDGECATLVVSDGRSDLQIRLVTQGAFEKPRVRAVFPHDAALARELRDALRNNLNPGR